MKLISANDLSEKGSKTLSTTNRSTLRERNEMKIIQRKIRTARRSRKAKRFITITLLSLCFSVGTPDRRKKLIINWKLTTNKRKEEVKRILLAKEKVYNFIKKFMSCLSILGYRDDEARREQGEVSRKSTWKAKDKKLFQYFLIYTRSLHKLASHPLFILFPFFSRFVLSSSSLNSIIFFAI